MILEHPLSTENNLRFSKKCLANSLDAELFKCTPFPLRCLFLTFLLIDDSLTKALSLWLFRYQFLV